MLAQLLLKLGVPLAWRESFALNEASVYFRKLLSAKSLKAVVSSVLVIAEVLAMFLFNGALTPRGEKIDESILASEGYKLVFEDQFNGNELDTTKWDYRANGERRGGYNAPDQVKVEDGNLVISAQYRDKNNLPKDTSAAYAEGWYVGMIKLKQTYKRGYFEIRCICNDSPGFWSAFWIQADHPYDPLISKGGVGGAELDIFESLNYNAKFKHNSVTQTVHCAGKGGSTSTDLNSCCLGSFKGDDIYHTFNTYGLKWTEDEYIFYVNGVETARCAWADGVSQEFEQVIVSLEIPDTESLPTDKTVTTDFVVDYVKIYQK
ncbi:MAG TPA: hypothetical protein DDY98_00860 [Ruminococcaceae bacterium]|nr:hypothetical protein [Oscillospiraceae bacterium]